MAFTAPRTWVAAELVTATYMNTHVRDNISALAAGYMAIASQAAGDVLYASSSTQLARLAIVSAGRFLRSNGSAPTWATTTIPDTIAQYKLLYASAANVLTATTNLAWNETTLTVTGTLGVGVTAAAKIHALATTEQLRLGYDAANYASFTISNGGDLTVAPSGADMSITGTLQATVGFIVSGTSPGASAAGMHYLAASGLTLRAKTGTTYDFTVFNQGGTAYLVRNPTGTDHLVIPASGSFSVGAGDTPAAKLHALATTEQLRLGYDAANYASFTVSSGGVLTIAPSGGGTSVTGTLTVSQVTTVTAGAIGLKVGGTAARATTAGTNSIHVFDGTAPVGTLANGISLYSAAGEGYLMDAAGNATLQTPHDRETNEWIFYSRNTRTGQVLRVDMERLVRDYDRRFGTGFVKEWVH